MENLFCFEVSIFDAILNLVQKCQYLGTILTENAKCGTEIRTRTGIAKDACQKETGTFG